MEGTVKFFNEGKGFGFIQADDGNEYFVHISGLIDEVREGDEETGKRVMARECHHPW